MSAPLFKWPGGKRWLAPYIADRFWRPEMRLFEPFAGGAALFFALEPNAAVLSDVNPQVINCYQWVRDDVETVIERLSYLRNSPDDYYQIRDWSPYDPLDQAVRFLYLARLSFNGIYRENLKGKFNVPYGKKTHLDVVQPDLLLRSSALLKRAELAVSDFEDAVVGASEGDMVYFDPPYTTAHNANGFIKYNAKIFSWSDQERLARVSRELADRGCTVISSNANHFTITELYPGFDVHELRRHSVIGSKPNYRGEISESLFVSSDRS